MPGKPFTQYLLLLATDASEVERFRMGGETARQSMHAAGLTDPILQNTLLDGDQAKIEAAVAAEIESADQPAGVRTMIVPLTTTIHYMAPPPPPDK